MIARNIQELADAINVMETRLTSTGVEPMGNNPHLFRMAEAFAKDLLLASSDAQVANLLQLNPRGGRAFLTIVTDLREELEGAGLDINSAPDVPLLLHAPAAEAVIDAIQAYRLRKPYLHLLRRQRNELPVGHR